MRGIFNRMYVSIYELPCEEKCTRDGAEKSAVSDEGLYGQGFEVIKRCVGSRGDFVRIRTDYGYDGYVRSGDVIICGDASICEDTSICENTSIYRGNSVYEDTSICRDNSVYKDTSICRDNSVYEHTSICRDNSACGDASMLAEGCTNGSTPMCQQSIISNKKEHQDYHKNKKHKFMQVKKSVADILSAPFVSAVRFMSVTRGAVLMCCGETYVSHPGCDYVCIRLYDGRAGYIKKSYLEPYAAPLDEQGIGRLDEDSFRERLVRTAKSYLGTQYRWGGKTPLGIDCSGLTSMAYMLNGVYIYRDARLVPGFAVKEIPYECMKKGDLIYFPGHIAMYTGDGEYIHSTAREGSDGVVINSLDRRRVRYREDLAQSICAVGSIFSACRQS